MIALNGFILNDLYKYFQLEETKYLCLFDLYFYINQFAMIENVIKVSVNIFV